MPKNLWHPKPGTITKPAFAWLLQLYPAVQGKAYKLKVKDPEKLAAALLDHDWRYDKLPKLVAERCSTSSSAYLDKVELVRLTQWKILHGQNRPFLPGMVKKNDQKTIKTVTFSAYNLQAGASYDVTGIPDSLDKALREAAQLHGVGPATATLVCSIFDPINVCFFEDELATWLCPDIPKLKYTWTEYKSLFSEIGRLRTRLGSDHKAIDIEKVGFVIGHLHLLDEHQREALTSANQIEGEAEQVTKNKAIASTTSSGLPDQLEVSSKVSKPKASKPKRKAKDGENIPSKQDDEKPKAKRRRK